MNREELANFLANKSVCDFCACGMEDYECMSIGCRDGIYYWLGEEHYDNSPSLIEKAWNWVKNFFESKKYKYEYTFRKEKDEDEY